MSVHEVDRLFCHTNLLFCSFLLVCDCFLATLASAGIVLGALSTHGQADTVTNATVASNIHQSLDVKLDFAAEVSLYFVIAADYFADSCCLSVGPVFYFDVFVHSGFLKDRVD